MSTGPQENPRAILTPVTHPKMIFFCDPTMFAVPWIFFLSTMMLTSSFLSLFILPVGLSICIIIHRKNPDFARVQRARLLVRKRRPSFYPLKKGRIYVP